MGAAEAQARICLRQFLMRTFTARTNSVSKEADKDSDQILDL